MTKIGRTGVPMFEPNASRNKEWLDVIMKYADEYCRRDVLAENFDLLGRGLNSELSSRGFPQINGGEYIAIWKGVSDAVSSYINVAEDKRTASGAVLWRFLKAEYGSDTLRNPEYYRKERRYQRNMMSLLGSFDLDLWASDKINALDFLDYKFSSEEYRRVYEKLGRFDYSDTKGDYDYDYALSQTVKVFHNLLKNSQKSTGKNRIISAKDFLETVSRYDFDDVYYDDGQDRKVIDKVAKQKMFGAMIRSKADFSENCLTYFSGQEKQEYDCVAFLGALVNKLSHIKEYDKQKSVLSRSFGKVHRLLAQNWKTEDKLVDYYSAYLSMYASYFCNGEEAGTKVLEALLRRNAAEKNSRRQKESLFPEMLLPQELPPFDKNVVLKVAENYASSFMYSDSELEEFNPVFHQKMAEMFGKIVTSGAYNKNDVQELCETLKQNGDPQKSSMARYVMTTYTTPGATVSSYSR